MRTSRLIRMAGFLALALFVAGCGGDDDDDGGDAGDGGDGGGDGPDAGADGCPVWQLEPARAPVDSLVLDPGALNAEKTVRALVQITLGECERRAIPEVTISEERATAGIRVMVWRQVAGECADPGGEVVHAIPLRLGREGSWTISAGDKSVAAQVDPPPDRECGTSPGACEMDCDCEGASERCLSGSGLAGPFTECALPCEVDRDCGGQGICQNVADGLAFACIGDSECGDGAPDCPDGWSCAGGACEPDFTLGASTRVECSCDADCDEPLSCVRPRPDQPGRCEIACPTQGPWCEGAHVCGPAEADVSGLATSDSVCISLGE